jgi:hypothetical protein
LAAGRRRRRARTSSGQIMTRHRFHVLDDVLYGPCEALTNTAHISATSPPLFATNYTDQQKATKSRRYGRGLGIGREQEHYRRPGIPLTSVFRCDLQYTIESGFFDLSAPAAGMWEAEAEPDGRRVRRVPENKGEKKGEESQRKGFYLHTRAAKLFELDSEGCNFEVNDKRSPGRPKGCHVDIHPSPAQGNPDSLIPITPCKQRWIEAQRHLGSPIDRVPQARSHSQGVISFPDSHGGKRRRPPRLSPLGVGPALGFESPGQPHSLPDATCLPFRFFRGWV